MKWKKKKLSEKKWWWKRRRKICGAFTIENRIACWIYSMHMHSRFNRDLPVHYEAIDQARSTDRSMCQLPSIYVAGECILYLHCLHTMSSNPMHICFFFLFQNCDQQKENETNETAYTSYRIAVLNCCRRMHFFFSSICYLRFLYEFHGCLPLIFS